MIVNRKAFADAVNHALVGISARPALPILSAVKMEAADGILLVSGLDDGTQATATIAADGDLPMTLTNGALLKDIVHKSKAEDMTLEIIDSQLHIAAGRAKVKLPIMPISEYPDPLVTPEQGFSMDGTGWEVLHRSVAHSASKEDSVPVLTSMHFTISNGEVTAQATDRYRLAQNTVSADTDAELSFMLPAKTVTDISRHLDTSSSWDIRVNDGLVAVSDGQSQIIRSLIDGEYPNISKLFPDSVANQLTVNRDDLSDAISRSTSLLAPNAPVILLIEGDMITVQAGAADLGAMTEQVDCENTGSDTELRFNPLYLNEALSALNNDEAVIGWNDTIKPVSVTGDDHEHKQIIMPIRRP